MSRHEVASWPSLSSDGWAPTRRTLHRYLQVVGKIRLSLVPASPYWWHTTLRPTTRGLTTGPMPYGGREVEISFDLVAHRLLVVVSDGRKRFFDLGARPACAHFYKDLFDALDDLGVRVAINPYPFDLGPGPSFPEDWTHDSYDAAAVTAYWHVLAGTGQVLAEFASRFAGESSPVHLFWHLMDLSYTRHPRHRGASVAGVDGLGTDQDTQVMAFGLGFDGKDVDCRPAFYFDISPEPERLVERSLEPAQAQWRTGSRYRAVLPYDVMRSSSDPGQTLLGFYESAYAAGARSAGWDVAAYATEATTPTA